MLTVGFRDLRDSANDLRNKQAVRRPYFLTASIPVPNVAFNTNPIARATLVCDEDADIYIFGLSGSVIAAADINGRRVANANTLWPMPLVGGIVTTPFAERGLKMRIFANSDKEDSLSDPQNFADVKTILQPGYAIGRMSRPFPFSRYLKRGDKLTFEFLNTDTGTGEVALFHYVTLTLSCRKYEPFTR